ncbi:MAG: PP2C family protein-serine/threonine phosphatase [Vulcanimicrobiota bacterium]
MSRFSTLLESLGQKFSTLPQWARCLGYVLMVTAIAGLDYLTGLTLQFSVFYALVVLCVGWFEGSVAAAATAVFAAGSALFADNLAVGFLPHFEWINQGLRTILWTLVGVGAAARRERSQQLAERQAELVHAYARINLDLEAAMRVQAALLDQPLPTDPRVEIVLHRRTARGLGGDFVEIKQQGDRLRLCIADVSGKGPPAALVTALLSGALRDAAAAGTPEQVLRELNARLEPHLPNMMFVTCLYAELDLGSGELIFANAGHDPGLIRGESGQLQSLDNTGMPLGVVTDLAITAERRNLAVGELLVWYTDGLTTAPQPDGTRMSEERLLELVTDLGEPTELADVLMAQVPLELQDDDVVVLVVARRRDGRR